MKKQIVFFAIVALITACQPPPTATAPSEPMPITYTITAKTSGGGQISPSSLTVAHGESATFLVTVSAGYVLSDIEGCSGVLEGDQFTIESVTSACELVVSFSPAIISYKTVLVEENIWEYRTSERMPDYVYAGKQFEGGLVSFFVMGQMVFDMWKDGFPDVFVPFNKGYASGIDTRFPPALFRNDGYRFQESSDELVGGMPAIPMGRRTVAILDPGDGFRGIFGVAHDTFSGKGTAADAFLIAAGALPENVTDQLPRLPLADTFGRSNAVDAHSLAGGDLNNDGMTDFIVGEWRDPRRAYKLIQYERGKWQVVEDPFLAYLTWDQPLENPEVGGGNSLLDLHLADVDGDSFDDLIAGWGHGSSKSYVYINDGQGGFSNDNRKPLPVSIYGVDNSLHMRTYSFDADGDDDLDLLINYSRLEPYYGGYTFQLLLNDGAGEFQDYTTAGILNLEGRDRSIRGRQEWSDNFYLLDVNHDNMIDIIGSDLEGVRLWLNEGGAVFREVAVHTYVEHRGGTHIFVDMGNGEISSLVFRQSWNDEGTETRIWFDQSNLVIEMLPLLTPEQEVSLFIYDDAAGTGWDISAWDGEIDLSSERVVHTGQRSIEADMDPWGAFSMWIGSLDTSQYLYLDFYINGGAQGGQQINVLAFNQDQVLTNLATSYYTQIASLPPGEWLQIRIPVEDLNPRNSPVTHIVIENHSDAPASTFYVDDIRFVAARP